MIECPAGGLSEPGFIGLEDYRCASVCGGSNLSLVKYNIWLIKTAYLNIPPRLQSIQLHIKSSVRHRVGIMSVGECAREGAGINTVRSGGAGNGDDAAMRIIAYVTDSGINAAVKALEEYHKVTWFAIA